MTPQGIFLSSTARAGQDSKLFVLFCATLSRHHKKDQRVLLASRISKTEFLVGTVFRGEHKPVRGRRDVFEIFVPRQTSLNHPERELFIDLFVTSGSVSYLRKPSSARLNCCLRTCTIRRHLNGCDVFLLSTRRGHDIC